MLTLSSTDTTEASINIPLKGSGISITKDGDALNFTPKLLVDANSKNYLEINGNVLKIRKGAVKKN
jgi:hypothetical protein